MVVHTYIFALSLWRPPFSHAIWESFFVLSTNVRLSQNFRITCAAAHKKTHADVTLSGLAVHGGDLNSKAPVAVLCVLSQEFPRPPEISEAAGGKY